MLPFISYKYTFYWMIFNMRYTELFEHVVNLRTADDKKKYSQEVWAILQQSYESCGGFHSAATVDELITKTGLWKLITRNGKISALGLYKDALGRKSIASGTDGSARGKTDFLKIKSEDLKMKRAWAEVSGSPEKMLKRAGAKAVPNQLASILTGKEILELNSDGFHYTRLISGHPHEKVIYGFVSLDNETVAQLQKSGVSISSLPDNIMLPN